MTDLDAGREEKIVPRKRAMLPAPPAQRHESTGTAPGRPLQKPSAQAKRASNGQRKQVRRQQQAGETKLPQ